MQVFVVRGGGQWKDVQLHESAPTHVSKILWEKSVCGYCTNSRSCTPFGSGGQNLAQSGERDAAKQVGPAQHARGPGQA